MTAASETPEGPVSVDVEIADGRTTITVTGDREASVIVRSASGEQIYLPPERTDDEDGDEEASPYQSGGSADSSYEGVSGDSPYEGIAADTPYDGMRDESPYDPAQQTEFERTRTANGFRILHPEPVTDFRFLR